MTGVAGARDPDDRARAEPSADSTSWDASARVAAGTVLGGKYQLISEIGRGGMGSVWRAEHLAWEAPVAVKIMNRDITARPEAVARFEREVRLAAGLRSPHVVQVLDHGLDEATRTPFIVMELLEGESLARRLKRLGQLSPAETFNIFSQLVRALTRAHAAGIVHRDLKPDNVFLVINDEESLTKVLDFGVAKWTAPDVSESGLTRPGSVVGTPYYMSPEQIQGSRDIDHRADLWALAAIACECLTGRRPFEAPDFAQLAVMLLGNQGRPLPSSLGHVPPGFDAWFVRATEQDIARRFQSAREMAQTLAPVCDVAPSSLGSDPIQVTQAFPQSAFSHHGMTGIRHDASSMGAVSNTSSRVLLNHGLWQRPMLKLVTSTALVTLLVTGGIAFWLTRNPATPAGGSSSVSADSAALRPGVSQPGGAKEGPVTVGAGPGIRPIRESSASPAGLAERSADLMQAERAPAPERATSAPRPANDDFDPEAAQRSVRAALLERPNAARSQSKRPKPSTARAKKPTPGATATSSSATSSSATSSSAPSRSGAEPSSRQAKPAPSPAGESAPSLVDGRRIRTSL